MSRSTQLFALLLSLWLLTGCGVKGGLTLPPDEPPSANDSTSQA